MAAARRCGDGVKTVLIASSFVDRARRLKHTLLHSAGSANACVHPLAPSERQLDSIGFDSDPSHEVLLADGTASLSDALLAFAEVPNGYLSISGLPKPSLCIADIEHGPALAAEHQLSLASSAASIASIVLGLPSCSLHFASRSGGDDSLVSSAFELLSCTMLFLRSLPTALVYIFRCLSVVAGHLGERFLFLPVPLLPPLLLLPFFRLETTGQWLLQMPG